MKKMQLNKGVMLTLLVLSFVSTACTTNVRPWEKGYLAKPTMVFGGEVLNQAFEQHIYASKETASGGYGVGGGGCGCN